MFTSRLSAYLTEFYFQVHNEVKSNYPDIDLDTLELAAVSSGGYLFTSAFFYLAGLNNTTLLTISKIAVVGKAILTWYDIKKMPHQRIISINQKKIQEILDESSKLQKDKSMLLWKTTHDHNDAGCTFHEVYNLRLLAQTHSIEFLPGDQLPTVNKLYDQINIKSHGFYNSIHLAPNRHLDMNADNYFNALKTHIKPGGIISIESCSAASENCSNIAQAISKACPEATIYAPIKDFSSSDVRYKLNGVPSFNQCGIDITAIYRKGIKQN